MNLSEFQTYRALEYQDYDEYYSESSPLCPCSEKEYELFEQLGYWIEYVGLILIGSFGIISNAVSIPILLSPPLSNLFNQTLVVLAIFDTIFIICDMLDSIRQYNYDLTAPYHTFLFPHVLYPLQNITMVGSIYTTVVVALERYVAVSKPFNVYLQNTGDGNILRWRKLSQYVGPVVAFSVFFNIPTFFEFQVVSDTVNNITSSRLMVTPLRENSVYILFYINLARIPITGLLPFLALCILNYLVYVHLVRRRKNILNIAHCGHYESKFNVEHRQAQTLFGVALIFFFGHLLRVALNLHEFLALQSALSSDELMRYGCYSRWPFWSMVSRSVSRLLMTTSSSSNLLVYCAISGIFRSILMQSVRKLPIPFLRDAHHQHNQNTRVHSFSSVCRRSTDTTVTSVRVTML